MTLEQYWAEALGELRIGQLRTLIQDTKPGTIILPGNMSVAVVGATFKEPWVAVSGPELTVLLDEIESSADLDVDRLAAAMRAAEPYKRSFGGPDCDCPQDGAEAGGSICNGHDDRDEQAASFAAEYRRLGAAATGEGERHE